MKIFGVSETYKHRSRKIIQIKQNFEYKEVKAARRELWSGKMDHTYWLQLKRLLVVYRKGKSHCQVFITVCTALGTFKIRKETSQGEGNSLLCH